MLGDRPSIRQNYVCEKFFFKACDPALDGFELRLDRQRESAPSLAASSTAYLWTVYLIPRYTVRITQTDQTPYDQQS
jgi:hypothetical protein